MLPTTREIVPTPIVLVVDDEALLRWALREGLAETGYTVREAGTAAEARAAVEACGREPLLVLLDLRLPDVRDLSLLRDIRRRRPDAPVVVMTAHAGAGDATEAARLGAFSFVTKPFDVSAMLDLVAEAWRARPGPSLSGEAVAL